jgi:hypothetical protein
MRSYAAIALSAADQYVYDGTHKYVTMAEASIYLGDLKGAQKHYKVLGEKESIGFKMKCYERAVLIYEALFEIKNEKDPFLVFLEETLLT